MPAYKMMAAELARVTTVYRGQVRQAGQHMPGLPDGEQAPALQEWVHNMKLQALSRGQADLDQQGKVSIDTAGFLTAVTIVAVMAGGISAMARGGEFVDLLFMMQLQQCWPAGFSVVVLK